MRILLALVCHQKYIAGVPNSVLLSEELFQGFDGSQHNVFDVACRLSLFWCWNIGEGVKNNWVV